MNLSLWSQDSSGGIVTGLRVEWRSIWASIRGRTDFSVAHNIQPVSGADWVSCPVGTGGCFRWGKVEGGREAEHSPLSSSEVNNGGTTPLLSRTSSWRHS
jgi:hypothetical protein